MYSRSHLGLRLSQNCFSSSPSAPAAMIRFSTIDQTPNNESFSDRAVYHKPSQQPSDVTYSKAGRIITLKAMSKSPEEGKIWEWRAFGKLSEALVARVRAHPVRMVLLNIQGEDLYLISPDSDQNVKLRRNVGGWVLK